MPKVSGLNVAAADVAEHLNIRQEIISMRLHALTVACLAASARVLNENGWR